MTSPAAVPPPPDPRRSGAAAWTLALGIVAAVLTAAIASRGQLGATGLEGTAAPAFTLPVANEGAPPGSRRGLDEPSGKVVLLHFWAPSCGPCVAESPSWQALYEQSRQPGADFEVLTVAGDDLDDVRAFLRDNAYTFTVLSDPAGAAHRAYGVGGIPHTVAISPAGVVARELVGAQDRADLQQALERARRFDRATLDE